MVVCDLYGRVSTAEQAQEGYSIGEQEDRLRKYAESHGWVINDVLMDGGFSGSNLQRPGIQKVIADAQSGKVNKVCVYKLDRLSRSQKDTLYIIEEIFIRNGVDFVSMTETLDTGTPLGMAIIGILSAFAQLERAQIKERMMLGRDARVKSGKYHGNNNNVVGYDYDKATNTLSQNSYDAMMVRNIFQMFVSGASESAIAKKVNESHWRGHQWTAAKIHRTLNQPLYIGQQRWKGELYQVEGCPNIISEDLWEAAKDEQLRRSPNVIKPQTSGQHKTLLGGILWCGCCGSRFNGVKDCGKTSTARYRYYCYNRIFKSHGLEAKPCDNRGWREDELNSIIIEQIKRLRDDEIEIKHQDNSSDQSALVAKISTLEAKKNRLIDVYALGNIDLDSLKNRIDTIQAEQDEIKAQLEELKKPSGMLNAEELKSVLEDFDIAVRTADPATGSMELYSIVHKLIQSITLTGDEVRIDWNIET